MTNKPAALRLADALEQQFPIGTAPNFLDGEAAAELRRLHAENADLLEALKRLCNREPRTNRQINYDWDNARAVVASVEGSQK